MNCALFSWLTGAFVIGWACIFFNGGPRGWKQTVDYSLMIFLWSLGILIMTARQLRGK